MESTYEVSITTARPDCADADVIDLIQRAVRTVLQQEGAVPCEVSVYLTDDREIQALNAAYRNKDVPTDVLSFPLIDDGDQLFAAASSADNAATDTDTDIDIDIDTDVTSAGRSMPLLLGDVVISVERAAQQAREYGHHFNREIAFLAVHGTLHLLGYDHQTEEERRQMREREEMALEALGLTR